MMIIFSNFVSIGFVKINVYEINHVIPIEMRLKLKQYKADVFGMYKWAHFFLI